MHRERASLLATLADSVDAFYLATQLELLVASLGDDATWMQTYVRPRNFEVSMAVNGHLFPAYIGAVGGGLVVLNGAQGLLPGDRLVRVSGFDIDSLVTALAPHTIGRAPRAPERIGNWLFYSPRNPGFTLPFAVEVRGADGMVRLIVAPGFTPLESWPTSWIEEHERHVAGRNFRTRVIGRAFVLTPQWLTDDRSTLAEQVGGLADSMRSAGTQILILDFRGISFMSAELAQQLRLQLEPSGRIGQLRAPVCVLLDRATADRAAMLSDQLSMQGMAVTIGEETAWHRNSYLSDEGQTYIPYIFSSLFLPAAQQPLGAGTNDQEHGVVPSIRRVRTAQDVAAGRDPALSAAMECAAR